ncbi:MAG: hypothetical protein ACOC3Y_01365 [Desulfohalobiaceae bacterium]
MNKNKVNFSRHAKRRMQLYKLTEENIICILQDQDPEFHFLEGKHEIVSKAKPSRYGYPIKVIFSCEQGRISVITAYPLKRGLK